MKQKHTDSRKAISILIGAVIALGSFTHVSQASSSLGSNSPFYPPGYNPNPKKPVAPPVQNRGPFARQLEFRGVAELDGAYRISIFNKADQKGYWIKVGEKKEGIHVTTFDLGSMTVTLNQNGRSERLSMMESTDSPLPVVASAPAPANIPSKPSTGNKNQPVFKPNTNSQKKTSSTVPRRRVILPKK
ncbi:MAG: hypothetical protein ACON5O_08050 [Lentimonas sp.]